MTCSQFPGPLPKTVGGAITDVGVTGALIAQASEHPGVQHAAKKVEKGVKAAENAAVDGACKLGEACLGAAQAITNAASGAIRGGKKKPQDIEMGQVGGNGRRRALQETPLYARVRSHDGLQDL